MSSLTTLRLNAEDKMEAAYKAVIKSIDTAMLAGKSDLVLSVTNDPALVSGTDVHMLTANKLVTNGFTVTRNGCTYTVSGWDKIKLYA